MSGNLSQLGMQADQEEPMRDFEALPPDRYTAVIIESDLVDTKAGTGKRLKLTFCIVGNGKDGGDTPFSNRRLWEGLNIENPSEDAVRISKAALAAICRAVGVLNPQDSSELHDKPLVLRVTRKMKTDGSGEMENKITGYYSTEEAYATGQPGAPKPAPAPKVPAKTAPAAKTATAPAPRQAGSPAPWRKK